MGEALCGKAQVTAVLLRWMEILDCLTGRVPVEDNPLCMKGRNGNPVSLLQPKETQWLVVVCCCD
jgi:hypothetical protein